MSLQEALKLMRLELGMTQADLAKKLNKALVSVSRWENGKGFPSRANAAGILRLAENGPVSANCLAYLNEVLIPEAKRNKSAAVYGFPDIDRDFLFQLADGSSNSLYVIEAGTYRLLYANRAAEKSAIRFLRDAGEDVTDRSFVEQTDKRCFHYFGGRQTPCPFCPLTGCADDEFTDTAIRIPESGRTVRLHAQRTHMKGRSVYAIYLTDITEADGERRALYEMTNDIPQSVGIYHVYYDGRIELAFMNQRFFRMIGPARREKLLQSGEADLCLVHPRDRSRMRAEIRRAVAEKRDILLTLRMQTCQNRYHTLRLCGRLLRKDAEKITFCCVFEDMDDADVPRRADAAQEKERVQP